MGDANAVRVIDALTKSNNTEVLDLSSNKVTDEAAFKIAELISVEESNLRVLMVKYNSILGKGGVQIANAVKVSKSLQIIDLSFNSITGLGRV